MGQLADRLDRIVRARVDHFVRAELAGEFAPLGRDVERDHARAHRDGKLRRGEAHRPLAEDRDCLAALQIEPLQRP